MDDTRCLEFFVQPSDAPHRRYEVLRAFFVERRPVAQIAQQFGYRTATVYALVRDFRDQARAGHIPPFSSSPCAEDHTLATTRRPRPRTPPSLMRGSCAFCRNAVCARASPASFSSCLCWLGSASTNWCNKPAIQARAWSPPSPPS